MVYSVTKSAAVYGVPKLGLTLEQCQFYHKMDIPGVGTVDGFEGGNWDLRPKMEEFIGGIDFVGSKVLEIGPASGLLTFEMERRGGELVVIEIPHDHIYDVLPYEHMKTNWQEAIELTWESLTNSWWFAHEKNESKAKVVYSGAYDIDKLDVGTFDVSYISNMLLHNRDPLKILQNVAKITTNTVVVVDIVDQMIEDSGLPLMKFHPNPNPQPGQEDWNQWWRLSTHAIKNMLQVMGFTRFEVTRFFPEWNGIPIESFRVVAHRV